MLLIWTQSVYGALYRATNVFHMLSISEILRPQPQTKILLLPLLLLFNICCFYKCKVQPNHFISVLSCGARSLCRDWQQRWAGEVHWPWCSPGILASPNPPTPPPLTFQRNGLAWDLCEVWFAELPSCINNSAAKAERAPIPRNIVGTGGAHNLQATARNEDKKMKPGALLLPQGRCSPAGENDGQCVCACWRTFQEKDNQLDNFWRAVAHLQHYPQLLLKFQANSTSPPPPLL